MNKIQVEINYVRPCLYNNQKALFHCFEERAEVLSPGIRPGGQYKETFAIIELENGDLIRVPYHQIKFIDTKKYIDQYCYEAEDERD